MPELEFIDPYAPKGEAKAVAAHSSGVSGTESHENGVPKGSTKEVLKWVGEDKERAQAALAAENEDETPRKGLLKELNELLESDDNGQAPVVALGDAGGNQPSAEPAQPDSNNDPVTAEGDQPDDNNADTGPEGGEALAPNTEAVQPESNNAPSSPGQTA